MNGFSSLIQRHLMAKSKNKEKSLLNDLKNGRRIKLNIDLI